GVGRDLAPCRHIADLGKELVPSLMGEHLARRAALDRSAIGDRIAKSRVDRIGAEVGMIRRSLGRKPTNLRVDIERPFGLVEVVADERHWLLQRQSGHPLGELLRAEQRAARSAGGDRGEGAWGERTKTILESQHAGRREYSPFEEIPSGDLPASKRDPDFRSIVARPLCLPLSDAGCLARTKVHCVLPSRRRLRWVRGRSCAIKHATPYELGETAFQSSPISR